MINASCLRSHEGDEIYLVPPTTTTVNTLRFKFFLAIHASFFNLSFQGQM